MPKLFKLTISTAAEKVVNVVAENAEEAQTKVTLAEGEAIATVTDEGEVVS